MIEKLQKQNVEDSEVIKRIIEGPLKLNKETVTVLNPVRMGTRKPSKHEEPEKHRPIKFSDESFEMKNKILKPNAELRKETGELKNIY